MIRRYYLFIILVITAILVTGCIIRVPQHYHRRGYSSEGRYTAKVVVINRANYPVKIYVARGYTKEYLGIVKARSKKIFFIRPGKITLLASGRAHFKHKVFLHRGDRYIWEINP